MKVFFKSLRLWLLVLCIFAPVVAHAVPNGFTELEYITSGTGTKSYVDSGVKFDFSKNFRVVGDVINPDVANRKVIISNYSGNEGSYGLEFGGSGQNKAGYFRNYLSYSGNVADRWSSVAFPANQLIKYDSYYNATTHRVDNTLKYNNTITSYTVTTITATVELSRTLYFFLDYRSSYSAIAYPVSIGKTKIYQDGVLIASFIPVKRDSDSKLGFYDVVNDVFRETVGTFTAGPEVGIKIATKAYNDMEFESVQTVMPAYMKIPLGYLTQQIQRVHPNVPLCVVIHLLVTQPAHFVVRSAEYNNQGFLL